MPWARFDDKYPEHPKVWGLSDGAYRLHSSATIGEVAKFLTDGVVAVDRLPRLIPRFKPSYVKELVAAGLFHTPTDRCEQCDQRMSDNGIVLTAGEFYVHGYLDKNPTRRSHETKSAARAEAGRVGGQRSGASRRGEANPKANASPVASYMREPPSRPVPSPLTSDPSTHTSSSKSAPDDDDGSPTITAAFALIAEKRLEERNRETTGRHKPITGPKRRHAWLAQDIARSRQHLGVLAATLLADQPDITPEDLARLLEPWHPNEED